MTLATTCTFLFLFPHYISYSALAILPFSETALQKIMDVIIKKYCKIGTARYKEYSTTQLVKLFHIIKANNDHHEVPHCQSPISSFSEDMACSFEKT